MKRLKLAAESEVELALVLRHLHTEVRVLSEVHHPNIVPLLGWSNDGDAPCLVYALMVGGSLEDRLACEGGAAPLSSNERICVLSDVARGLAYLHSVVQIIHLDVKSANVLIDHGCVGRIGDHQRPKTSVLPDLPKASTVSRLRVFRPGRQWALAST